jgi:hypothetical protein
VRPCPGGTIQRVENDAEGSPYEAHMTKSDGSRVTPDACRRHLDLLYRSATAMRPMRTERWFFTARPS